MAERSNRATDDESSSVSFGESNEFQDLGPISAVNGEEIGARIFVISKKNLEENNRRSRSQDGFGARSRPAWRQPEKRGFQ